MEPDQRTGSTPPKEQMPQAVEKKGNPSQSPATTNVYVRRRVEIDTSKDTVIPPPPDWEERYHHLQILLNKLGDSDQTDHHLHMLWSLSSAELSKHAVDLEKRSIQLSLEEAREMQRVATLNVLGRSVNTPGTTVARHFWGLNIPLYSCIYAYNMCTHLSSRLTKSMYLSLLMKILSFKLERNLNNYKETKVKS
ncbi:hypothetical protein Bca52824_012255 [Brassica carinata]|uniref:Uncharacterized protein n=1 Tax=Brassica carinata TaxID=52824 RepID=A0A8X8B234_BRACI|nr:hypothetical protein Bca52824_012255 [Brassica carinata]